MVRVAFAIMTLIVGWLAGLLYVHRDAVRFALSPSGRSVALAYSALQHEEISRQSEVRLTDGALQGLVDAVGAQNYATYLSAQEYLKYTTLRQTDHIGSLGIFINTAGRQDLTTLIVTRVLPGEPADKAGVRPGDVVTKIGDETATVANLGLIQGQVGTPVNMTFRRHGCSFTRHFVRASVGYDSVEAQALAGVLVVRLSTFQSQLTAQKLFTVLKAWGTARPVVLDLRDNNGGALRQADEALGLFLWKRRLYSYQNLAGQRVEVNAQTTVPPLPNRLILIVNRNTASSAEIFASALQEAGRAIVIGETTFGKGRANTELVLPNGGMLIFSNAEWFTSHGRQIDRQGLTPDVRVLDNRFLWPSKAKFVDQQCKNPVSSQTTDQPLEVALGKFR